MRYINLAFIIIILKVELEKSINDVASLVYFVGNNWTRYLCV